MSNENISDKKYSLTDWISIGSAIITLIGGITFSIVAYYDLRSDVRELRTNYEQIKDFYSVQSVDDKYKYTQERIDSLRNVMKNLK